MNQQDEGQGRKNTQTEQKNEKRLKENEEYLRECRKTTRNVVIFLSEIPEGGEEEQRIEYLFKRVMTENFPNLLRGKVT